jgi:hypothetical protein
VLHGESLGVPIETMEALAHGVADRQGPVREPAAITRKPSINMVAMERDYSAPAKVWLGLGAPGDVVEYFACLPEGKDPVYQREDGSVYRVNYLRGSEGAQRTWDELTRMAELPGGRAFLQREFASELHRRLRVLQLPHQRDHHLTTPERIKAVHSRAKVFEVGDDESVAEEGLTLSGDPPIEGKLHAAPLSRFLGAKDQHPWSHLWFRSEEDFDDLVSSFVGAEGAHGVDDMVSNVFSFLTIEEIETAAGGSRRSLDSGMSALRYVLNMHDGQGRDAAAPSGMRNEDWRKLASREARFEAAGVPVPASLRDEGESRPGISSSSSAGGPDRKQPPLASVGALRGSYRRPFDVVAARSVQAMFVEPGYSHPATLWEALGAPKDVTDHFWTECEEGEPSSYSRGDGSVYLNLCPDPGAASDSPNVFEALNAICGHPTGTLFIQHPYADRLLQDLSAGSVAARQDGSLSRHERVDALLSRGVALATEGDDEIELYRRERTTLEPISEPFPDSEYAAFVSPLRRLAGRPDAPPASSVWFGQGSREKLITDYIRSGAKDEKGRKAPPPPLLVHILSYLPVMDVEKAAGGNPAPRLDSGINALKYMLFVPHPTTPEQRRSASREVRFERAGVPIPGKLLTPTRQESERTGADAKAERPGPKPSRAAGTGGSAPSDRQPKSADPVVVRPEQGATGVGRRQGKRSLSERLQALGIEPKGLSPRGVRYAVIGTQANGMMSVETEETIEGATPADIMGRLIQYCTLDQLAAHLGVAGGVDDDDGA